MRDYISFFEKSGIFLLDMIKVKVNLCLRFHIDLYGSVFRFFVRGLSCKCVEVFIVVSILIVYKHIMDFFLLIIDISLLFSFFRREIGISV